TRALTARDPFDLLEYYRRVPEFPHESTADQWFNESQFESYRRLGLHVAETAFQRIRERPEKPVENTTELFDYLHEFWHPPSPTVGEHAIEHAEEYSRLMEILRSRTELRSLDHALFVDVPLDGLKQRDEFYICTELIQLMENVYADLDLEKYYAHPHVQGWMSVFQKWAQHG